MQSPIPEITELLAVKSHTMPQLSVATGRTMYAITRAVSQMVREGVAVRSNATHCNSKLIALVEVDPNYVFEPIGSDHLIIDAIHHGNLTAKKIAIHCGIDKSSAHKRLKKLCDARVVFYIGSRNAYTAGSAEMYYGNSPDTKIPRNWKEKKVTDPQDYKPVVPFRDWLDVAFFGAAPTTGI